MSTPRRVATPEGTRWVYRFELPPDPATGERRQKRVTERTKAACLERERGLRAAPAGRASRGQDRTVGAYLAYWLEHVAPLAYPNRNTRVLAGQIVRVHVLPQLGETALGRLTPERCQAWISGLAAAGCAAASVVRYHSVAKRALDHAVATGQLAANPLAGLALPRIARRDRPVWSREEIARFLAVAGRHPWHPFWLLLLTTGLRIGEITALRWEDVDLAAGSLRVARQVDRWRREDDPKTRAGLRTIWIDERTVAALAAHREEQRLREYDLGARYVDAGLVCCSTIGTRLAQATAWRRLQALCARAGVPAISLHDVRRTHITRLIDAGTPLKLVSRRAGHADVRTTSAVYYTVEEQAERRVAGAIGEAIFGDAPRPIRSDSEGGVNPAASAG